MTWEVLGLWLGATLNCSGCTVPELILSLPKMDSNPAVELCSSWFITIQIRKIGFIKYYAVASLVVRLDIRQVKVFNSHPSR